MAGRGTQVQTVVASVIRTEEESAYRLAATIPPRPTATGPGVPPQWVSGPITAVEDVSSSWVTRRTVTYINDVFQETAWGSVRLHDAAQHLAPEVGIVTFVTFGSQTRRLVVSVTTPDLDLAIVSTAWSATSGTFIGETTASEVEWIPDADLTPATVTVVVTFEGGITASASVSISP